MKTVLDIHPCLLNADRLGYYRRSILVACGLVPAKVGAGGGDKFLLDMFYWVKTAHLEPSYCMYMNYYHILQASFLKES